MAGALPLIYGHTKEINYLLDIWSRFNNQHSTENEIGTQLTLITFFFVFMLSFFFINKFN